MIGASSSQTESKPKKPSMAILRLQKDLKDLQTREIKYLELEFPQEDSIQEMVVIINLELTKEDTENCKTPYNHTITKFSLSFSNSYPM